MPSGMLEEEEDGELSTVGKHSQILGMISNL